MLIQCFPDVWFKGVYSFLDSNDLLSTMFTRTNDKIHLGPRGIAKLVTHIKSCVYTREIISLSSKHQKSRQESANVTMGSPRGKT